MRSIVTTLLILGIALGGNPAYANCESDCREDYLDCYASNPACEGPEDCIECGDEYGRCLDRCPPLKCSSDTCSSCSRPDAVANDDGDGVPDRLEYDLAHKYFPHIMLQHYSTDLHETYLDRGWAIPYTVEPRTTGVCNEDRECLEIRYGIAYRYDWGDPFWGGGHLGDSEFYAALVMRTTSWSTASTDVSSWELIRDFTAAHWGVTGDSSEVGAYGDCPPYCHQWDHNETACDNEVQCSWFPGLCYGVPSQPWDSCSFYWEDDDCYAAGCQWEDTACFPPSQFECYSTSPVSWERTLYAAEGKHALYHTDSDCDGGGFGGADDCPNNLYDMRLYKGDKLQNIGQHGASDDYDTMIQHPNGCDLYDVWGGAPFGDPGITAYVDHFLAPLSWSLPDAPPAPASGNPFSYANARDQFLACYGMAGRISSNCRDISVFDDKQMCYSMSESTQSYCTQITDRNLQLACYGMSINWSSNCRDITDTAMKNFCYGVSGNNSSYCYSITATDTRLLCLALATDSASHCSGISSSNDRQFCRGVASLNNSYCASIQ